MASLRIPQVSNNSNKIQLSRISHVYFEHPDLDKFIAFAEAFGFVEAARQDQNVYFRGYGRDQYVYVASQSSGGEKNFRGAAFVAASLADFEKAKAIPGAILKELDAPGGGSILTIKRPGKTFIHIIYGQQDRQSSPTVLSATHESQGPYNKPLEKQRKGDFQRYHHGPALVHKLGHFGYVCANFDEEVAFYTSNFNFVPSDVLYAPEHPEVDVMAFMHLDLGQEYSDHHTLFLARAPAGLATYLHHTSYEVEDFDTQLIGHEYLLSKSYKPAWGVGRHVLGSQIFDYWFDSSGWKIEHYADGDVVNESTGTKRDVAGPLAIWGPDMPKTFHLDETKGLMSILWAVGVGLWSRGKL